MCQTDELVAAASSTPTLALKDNMHTGCGLLQTKETALQLHSVNRKDSCRKQINIHCTHLWRRDDLQVKSLSQTQGLQQKP